MTLSSHIPFRPSRRFTALVIGLLSTAAIGHSEEPDPVALYYWGKAREVASQADPNGQNLGYRFTASSFRHTIGPDSRIIRTDTVVQEHFYTRGELDSVKLIRGDDRKIESLDLSHPLILQNDYHLGLFPNDTGGAWLAISIMSDSTRAGQPDGLVLVDRYRYYLHSLYLYYPSVPGFRHFTRSWRFTLVDGYVFPDSVWVIATARGIFSTESYRVETGIGDIQIERLGNRAEP